MVNLLIRSSLISLIANFKFEEIVLFDLKDGPISSNNLLLKNIESLWPKILNNRNKKTIKKNLKLKNKIKLHNFGLSNINSKLKVKSLRKNNYTQTGGTSVLRKYAQGTYVETLEKFKKGDDILNFKKVRLGIKIDVEGYELEVLRGMINILKNNRCIIQIEIFNKNYPKVYNFLSSINYRLIAKVDKRSNYFFISM